LTFLSIAWLELVGRKCLVAIERKISDVPSQHRRTRTARERSIFRIEQNEFQASWHVEHFQGSCVS
jgi:hypothetical protein